MVRKKILHLFRRFFILPFIFILVVPIGVSVFDAAPAIAGGTDDHIRGWLYFRALVPCLHGIHQIQQKAVDTYNSLDVNGKGNDPVGDIGAGVYVNDNSMTCDTMIQAGLPLWGYGSLRDLVLDAGYHLSGGYYVNDASGSASEFKRALREKKGYSDSITEQLNNQELYTFYHQSFVNSCLKGQPEELYDDVEKSGRDLTGYYTYIALKGDGTSAKYAALKDTGSSGSTGLGPSLYVNGLQGGKAAYDHSLTCGAIASEITNYAIKVDSSTRLEARDQKLKAQSEAFLKAVCKDDPNPSDCEKKHQYDVKNCTEIARQKVETLSQQGEEITAEKEDNYMKDYFADCYAKKVGKTKEEILNLIAGTKPSTEKGESPGVDIDPGTQGDGGSGDDEEEGKPECKIDGVGWLVCPIIEFLGNIADDAQEQLEKYLKISSSILTERDPGSVYDYWSMVRNYANIAFVIVFLVIVYSQITGTGIDNYGIKRMLPRLVVGVVMVNISFYICALMVDISNLLGASAYEFITNLGGKGSEEVGDWTSKGNLLTTIGAAAIVVASGFFFLSATLGGLVFVVLLAVTTVFLLGVRQAMVIFLIILSPLAFVAMLLPNTEGLYKKWWKTLQTMLYMYPVIGLIYGASRLAARILNEQQDKPVSMQVVSAILMFAPLLIVPNIIKSMLAIGGIAGMVGAANNFLNKHVGGKAREFGQRLKDNNSIVQAYRTGKEQRAKNRATRRAMRMHKGISGVVGRVRGGKTWKQRAENSAIAAEDKEIQERVDDAAAKQARLTHQERMDIAKTGMVKDKKGRNVKASDEEREAAVAYAMKAGDVYERRDTLEGLYGSDSTRVRRVAVAGARERGDTELYGNGVLSQIENGSKESDAKNKQTMGTYSQQMSAQLVERMQTGGISNEKMHQDYKTATMLSNAAVGQHTNTSGQADGTLDTGTDKHGNQRANSVSQARRQEMKDRAIEWQKTEDGQGKADNIRKRWEDLSTK